MISKNRIKLIQSMRLRKYRDRSGLFLAEGNKLVTELLPHFQPVWIGSTEEWLNSIKHRFSTSLYSSIEAAHELVTESDLHKASLQTSPQEVMALFRQRPTMCATDQTNGQHDLIKRLDESYTHHLVISLDGVQDPGNLGTIIRIADWYGIPLIICSQDTVDVYNPKVIQATMGSIARVEVAYTDLADLLSRLTDQWPVYGTFLDGQNIYTTALPKQGILVMGNEGNGISKDIASMVSHRLLIPSFQTLPTHAESLNVATATAIACSEWKRRTFQTKDINTSL